MWRAVLYVCTVPIKFKVFQPGQSVNRNILLLVYIHPCVCLSFRKRVHSQTCLVTGGFAHTLALHTCVCRQSRSSIWSFIHTRTRSCAYTSTRSFAYWLFHTYARSSLCLRGRLFNSSLLILPRRHYPPAQSFLCLSALTHVRPCRHSSMLLVTYTIIHPHARLSLRLSGSHLFATT